MAAKRLKDHYYVVERAPLSMPCSEEYCTHFVVAGVKVVALVTKERYSWKKPVKKYKCHACSKRFLKRITAMKRAKQKKSTTRTKV